MLAGVPIVASDVGGVSDLVTHNQDGLLVPPGDPVALAEALARLLSDKALAARLVDTASHKTVVRYTMAAMADNHLRAFRALSNA
jgi:glycosyltransferase involved in cell wall biosynthesis